MNLAPRPPSLGIDLCDPIARDHPLNGGRVGWWLAVAESSGGPRWYDLAARSHATLAGSASWATADRPGGERGLAFAAGGLAAAPFRFPAGFMTAGCWFRASAGSQGLLEATEGPTIAGGNFDRSLWIDAAGKLNFYLVDLTGGFALHTVTTTAGFADGQWHRVLAVVDGSARIYVDGAEAAPPVANALSGFNGFSTPHIVIGQANQQSTTAARIDDVAVWSRGLSAAEARADWAESRQGYPDAIRRIRPPSAALVASAPTPAAISPAGIASAESFGLATLAGTAAISPAGIASAESFGLATLAGGVATISPAGIASAESFGLATLAGGTATVAPSGIASAESFGLAALAGGTATISPAGIASAGAFGTAVLGGGTATIGPAGIASAESFGLATLAGGTATISPAGIASAGAFGRAWVGIPDYDLPPDLAAAIEARLTALLVGTDAASWCGVGPAPAGTPLPYLDVRPADDDEQDAQINATTWLATGALSIAAFAGDRAAARELGALAQAALREAPPLRFAAGPLMVLRRDGRTLTLDPDPAPDGGECWMELRRYEYRYSYTQ